MTRKEAKKCIEDERIVGGSFFELGFNSPNQVVIKHWWIFWYIVYTTDERASAITGSTIIYRKLSDALDTFMLRLRAQNSLMDSMRKEDRWDLYNGYR